MKLGCATAFCSGTIIFMPRQHCTIAIPILITKTSFPLACQPLTAPLSLLFPMRLTVSWALLQAGSASQRESFCKCKLIPLFTHAAASSVHPHCMADLDNERHGLNIRTSPSLLAQVWGGLVPSFLGEGTLGLFPGELGWVWEDFPPLWSSGKGTGGLSAVEGLGLNSHSGIGVLPIE